MYSDLEKKLSDLIFIKDNKPEILYHYCNSTGLLGILRNYKLWATHTFYLNDTTEINYTHELIEEIHHELLNDATLSDNPKENRLYQSSYRELLHRFSYKTLRPKPDSNIFVICFCEQKDLLSQWRGYGNNGYGYSVGFKTNQLGSDLDFKLYKIIYSKDKQKEILRKMMDEVISHFRQLIIGVEGIDNQGKIADKCMIIFEKKIINIAARFKHPSFHEEKEWRLIFDYNNKQKPKEIKFRSNINGIIPYIEYPYKKEVSPIGEICLGPTVRQETATKSLIMLKDDLDLHVDIINSNIPFR